MKITQRNHTLNLRGASYDLTHDRQQPFHVKLRFDSGIGADLFVASGCDRDDGIDELVSLEPPQVKESAERVTLTFVGKTTLWKRVEYVFTCEPERVAYGYRVHGKGQLEIARFFEGFLQKDPRMDAAYYPYFCGPGRHLSHHRSAREFMQSSTPGFDQVYAFGINSVDKRIFGYYEDVNIRVNGDRHYIGGDWLATPAPFLYLMGRKGLANWVTLGLAVKTGEAGFMGYHYSGGEGFGLHLDYSGYTQVDGSWESPRIVMEQAGGDEYQALDCYVAYLRQNG
ncbi:MAG: hypothetical protein ACOYMG_28390, partial [Candidatus Methylumidiphilus sp.]